MALGQIEGGDTLPMTGDMIYMKSPADREGRMWASALPIGNGITGALLYGAIAEETVIVTRHDLWENCVGARALPDLRGALQEMRDLIDAGAYEKANSVMQEQLAEGGFGASIPNPFPLGVLRLCADFNTGGFKHYRRGIDMEKATAFATWEDRGAPFVRTAFISRDDGILYIRVRSGHTGAYTLSFDACEHPHESSASARSHPSSTVTRSVGETYLCSSARYDGVPYGAVVSVTLHRPGEFEVTGDQYRIVCPDFTVKLATYAKEDADEACKRLTMAPDYDTALARHAAIYTEIYSRTSIRLAPDDDPDYGKSNEELLADAYEDEASPVLCEKLWKFGRYLFISGTSENANPFSLYGIWAGDCGLPWAQHVANQNVEMIYWHTLAGGLSESMRGLIHYYIRKMPSFRENAERLFGCRGIYVPAYTFPETLNGEDIAPPVPGVSVVLNWISCAGWLSDQFYRYYEYTQDRALLQAEILPFMVEAARFYTDYVSWDAAGHLRIYPSVSPENTPRNFLSDDCKGTDYLPCPVAENATMDFAILKALLRHLLEMADSGVAALDADEVQGWRTLLAAIPAYAVNADGALKEWLTPDLQDHYAHRHFSHLFPLFPGDEINPNRPSELLDAARRAAELRQSDAQSGWSFAHSACVWARLHDGERVMESIDRMTRGCLLSNFFTTHNDWRHMGVSLYLDYMAPPIQLDALIGLLHVIQEMLLQEHQGELTVLPALSRRFQYMEARGLQFPGGELSLTYDGHEAVCTLTGTRAESITIHSPTVPCRVKRGSSKGSEWSQVQNGDVTC